MNEWMEFRASFPFPSSRICIFDNFMYYICLFACQGRANHYEMSKHRLAKIDKLREFLEKLRCVHLCAKMDFARELLRFLHFSSNRRVYVYLRILSSLLIISFVKLVCTECWMSPSYPLHLLRTSEVYVTQIPICLIAYISGFELTRKTRWKSNNSTLNWITHVENLHGKCHLLSFYECKLCASFTHFDNVIMKTYANRSRLKHSAGALLNSSLTAILPRAGIGFSIIIEVAQLYELCIVRLIWVLTKRISILLLDSFHRARNSRLQ